MVVHGTLGDFMWATMAEERTLNLEEYLWKKDCSSTWAPGESGEIRVRYDTKRVGVINKSVTIQSNAMNSDNITRVKKDSEGKVIGGTSTIRIKGEVKAPKTNATPMKPAQGPVNSSE